MGAPGLMVGWTEQKQTIPVTFFATFHSDPHAEVRAFHIEVKSKLVQVAQATLHIEANLSGLIDSTPQAIRDQPTIANKMKWFFLRQAFKVTVKLAKVTVIIALVVLCYEASMQGSEANWENVSASTKEDLIAF